MFLINELRMRRTTEGIDHLSQEIIQKIADFEESIASDSFRYGEMDAPNEQEVEEKLSIRRKIMRKISELPITELPNELAELILDLLIVKLKKNNASYRALNSYYIKSFKYYCKLYHSHLKKSNKYSKKLGE